MKNFKPPLFSYPKQYIKNHYRSHYQNKHWLQRKYDIDHLMIDMESYYLELRLCIIRLLMNKGVIHESILLEDLHKHLSPELKTYGNDGISQVSKFLYETDDHFKQLWLGFIHHILYKKIIQQPFYFQATPTFRIHCPNAPHANFFPHYHTDLALGHPPYEMNLWIPLTEKRAGHGFYLASLKHSQEIANTIDYDLPKLMEETTFRDKDYLALCEPKLSTVEIDAGQALLFDGRCFHTAMPVLDHSRLSIDFRIVLKEDFDNAEIIYENCGIRRKFLLLPHDYYHPHTSAELVLSPLFLSEGAHLKTY